ncbi:hypothetical protein GCM10023080_053450 [Streptomyces pseudoechinosporeus]
MAVLLRASMTSEEAADLLRRHVTSGSVEPVAATVDAPDARLRARSGESHGGQRRPVRRLVAVVVATGLGERDRPWDPA